MGKAVVVRLSEARHQTELLLFVRKTGIEVERVGEDALSVRGVGRDYLVKVLDAWARFRPHADYELLD